MTMRIHLREVRLPCRLGITAEERAMPQEIVVDATLDGDWGAAVASERLGDTVDYAAVRDLLEAVSVSKEWVLVESLADAMCQEILKHSNACAVRILVRKPEALRHQRVGWAGVELERRRDG